MPALPSFKLGNGPDLCTSIISLTKATGWENSLIHVKKTQWFVNNSEIFLHQGVSYVVTRCAIF